MRAVAIRQRLAVAGAVLSLAVLAPGCFFGGDDVEKVEADDWVDDFCEATADLDDAEMEAYLEYDDAYIAADEGDGESVEDAFNEFLDTYEDALNDYLEEIEKMGQPDVDGGDEIVKAVKQFVEDELEVIEKAREDLEDLDEEGEDLIFAVDDVFADMEFADLRELLEDSDSDDADEIIELIEDDEECASFLFQS